ncbi:MAG TPA: patatin-like phospholipase family protein [Casimicrobiaceae bacterium]
MALADHETGLILSGGGARAAYQAGALRGLAHVLGRNAAPPFPVICGTSAGAINAATLAVHADDFRRAVARLVRWWRAVTVDDVYRTDLWSLAFHGVRFLGSLAGLGRVPEQVAAMLDNAPLGRTIGREIDLSRIDRMIKQGALRALAVNATSYATGQAVTFFQGALTVAPWHRMRRRGERCTIGVEHLMASTAIPFVFPAARLRDDYYMDGSVRQITPLSPALHLGARRLVVIAVGQFSGQRTVPAGPPRYPSFAQLAGHALSSIFLDNLGADLERLLQMNRVIDLAERNGAAHARLPAAHVDAFVISPSQDLGDLARAYVDRLPAGVRSMLRGFGSTQGTGANLPSYLLFDRGFCRRLMALGYADTLARREEIAAFLSGAHVRYVPLTSHVFG